MAGVPTGASGPVDLGVRLRGLRGVQSQREVAGLLGVSTASLSAWESGESVPPRARVAQYVHFLGHGRESLLTELLRMRGEAKRMEAQHRRESVLDVVLDIRGIVLEIRDLLREMSDRLPPRIIPGELDAERHDR